MKFFFGINNIKKYKTGCVFTMGNFDGIHLGHQRLLNKLKKESIIKNIPSVVMIFEPHPIKFFYAMQAPFRLTCLRMKLYFLSQIGIDVVICMHFNKKFSLIKPNFFIKLLVTKINIKTIIIGKDVHFGYKRLGNFLLLSKLGIKYGFSTYSIKKFFLEKKKVSSTIIRNFLLKNNLIYVKKFLGRNFTICGRVIHGDSFGRIIGFPTANIFLKHSISAMSGIYAVYVYGIYDYPLKGILNIGIRPTISETNKYQCEVHIFNINKNLYGKYIYIEFIKKIRKEKKFFSIDELKKQIRKDIIIVKKIFSKPWE